MASGTRSIVWRSDIDAGRERPAFFFCAAERGGRTQLTGQLAEPACGPAKQDPAVPAFHDIAGAGRKGREKRGENRERGGWREEEREIIC